MRSFDGGWADRAKKQIISMAWARPHFEAGALLEAIDEHGGIPLFVLGTDEGFSPKRVPITRVGRGKA